jgi:hypothetical protein
MFPKTWVDDILDTISASDPKANAEESVFASSLRTGTSATIDKSDPLQIIKDSITK